MKITVRRSSLLYDVSNLAFVLGDISGVEAGVEAVHQVMDITQEGNIDRVERVADHAFLTAVELFAPCGMKTGKRRRGGDFIATLPAPVRCEVTVTERRLLEEGIHEYMVCRVLADWLSVTLPKLAAVWTEKGELALAALTSMATTLAVRYQGAPLRRLPFPV